SRPLHPHGQAADSVPAASCSCLLSGGQRQPRRVLELLSVCLRIRPARPADEAHDEQRGHHAHDPGVLHVRCTVPEDRIHDSSSARSPVRAATTSWLRAGESAAEIASCASRALRSCSAVPSSAARPSLPRRWRYAISATISRSGSVSMFAPARLRTMVAACASTDALIASRLVSSYGTPSRLSARTDAATSSGSI